MQPLELAQLVVQHWPQISALPELENNPQNYPVIAAYLTRRPMIANPTPRGTVPLPLSLEHVFGVLAQLPNADTEMPKLAALPDWAYQGATAAMVERNPTSIGNWLVTVSKICGFTQTTVDALNGAKTQLLAATIEDPNWQATVPGDAITDEQVTAGDVQGADQASQGAWYRS